MSSTDGTDGFFPLLFPLVHFSTFPTFRPPLHPRTPSPSRAQVYKKNQLPPPDAPPPVPGQRPEFDLDEVLALMTDAFTGATERHIEVGDAVEFLVIEKGAEMRWVTKELKRD